MSGPTPRPSLISIVMDRETTSREARSFAVGAYLAAGRGCRVDKGEEREEESREERRGEERRGRRRGEQEEERRTCLTAP